MGKFANITIGADPELFLRNPNSGAFVSAHEYIPGTKKNPYPVDKGAIQLDGVAAEFNIEPCVNANQFVGNIHAVMAALTERTKGTGYVLAAEPVADFDPDYFNTSIPDSCKVLGCDPDFNAWDHEPNETPDAGATFRTGSGHVHVGWGHGFDTEDPDHFMLCAEVAKQLDYYLGIHSLLWDPDNRRRSLYGKAGAFRPKPYGMEYRVLSNAWLRSEMLQRWVFTATKLAMHDLDNGTRAEDFFGVYARDVINENVTDWINKQDAPTFEGLPLPPGVRKAA